MGAAETAEELIPCPYCGEVAPHLLLPEAGEVIAWCQRCRRVRVLDWDGYQAERLRVPASLRRE